MASTCLDKNLLAYDGTSQLQRELNALAATYARLDERTASDLILFAKNYAAFLNYYDSANDVNGDWQPFMNNDPAVIIANIAELRTKDFIPFTEYVNSTLQTESDPDSAKQ